MSAVNPPTCRPPGLLSATLLCAAPSTPAEEEFLLALGSNAVASSSAASAVDRKARRGGWNTPPGVVRGREAALKAKHISGEALKVAETDPGKEDTLVLWKTSSTNGHSTFAGWETRRQANASSRATEQQQHQQSRRTSPKSLRVMTTDNSVYVQAMWAGGAVLPILSRRRRRQRPRTAPNSSGVVVGRCPRHLQRGSLDTLSRYGSSGGADSGVLSRDLVQLLQLPPAFQLRLASRSAPLRSIVASPR